MIVDEVLPNPTWRTHHEIEIAASPSRVYRALRTAEFGRAPVVRALLAARGMRSPLAKQSLTLDGLAPRGFVVVRDVPDVEIVLGLVGKFWTPRGGVKKLTPGEFLSFDEPGNVKAAWNFRIEPRGGVCTLVTETRIVATSADARAKFARYWFVVRPFSGILRAIMLREIKREAEKPA